MAKPFRVGLWIAIVGIALATQGCWDEQQNELTLLGEGGCRMADGGEGVYTNVAATSADECEEQCFAGGETCTAVEYNSNNNVCEVHSRPIAKYAKVEGVSCFAMR